MATQAERHGNLRDMNFEDNDEEEEFDAELYKEAWDWLYVTHPTIADKIELLLRRGWTPDRVRSHVIRKLGTNREDFAKRCENSLRYLLWIQRK